MSLKHHSTTFIRFYRATLFLLAWIAWANFGVAQEISVQSDSGAPVKVTAAVIAGMPHQTVWVELHGKSIGFEGVPLRLLIEKAGITFGESLHGKRLASYLLVEAADGYRVVFALPELDPGFTDRVILLADRADGHPLDNKDGPFRIVVTGEKRMARSARQVIALRVLTSQ